MKIHASVKRIAQTLKVSKDKAQQIKDVIEDIIHPESFNDVQNWLSKCYNSPNISELKMCALSELLGGYGVEGYSEESNVFLFDYINMGDTYTPTIIRQAGKYYLSNWGTFAEKYIK